MKQRVIVYVDGFNFYYGLRENNWKKYYWLDMVKFCELFMNTTQELIKVKYFSAPAYNTSKEKRQSAFFSANKSNNKFELVLGSYILKSINCQHCTKNFDVPEEKKTDVNIATHLISDFIHNECDVSILVSGDSDLTPPIEFIKNHKKNHIITVFFPPNRQGQHLKSIAHNNLYLIKYKQRFKECQFPDKFELPSGYILNRPEKWK